MSSLNKLPKLHEDSLMMMSADEDQSTKHNLDLPMGPFSPGSALQLRQSIYEKNRRDFKKTKLASPMPHSSRNYRSDKNLSKDIAGVNPM